MGLLAASPATYGVFLVLTACALFIRYLAADPLRKFNGPPLAALVPWLFTYPAMKAEWHTTNLKWHRRYGSAVRIAPNFLSFDTYEAFCDIYSAKANFRKAPEYMVLSPSRRGNAVSTQDKKVSQFKRKSEGPFFGDKSIRDLEDRYVDKVASFTTLLCPLEGPDGQKSAWTEPRDISKFTSWLTLDVITDLLYGESFDLLHSEENRWVPETFRNVQWRNLICMSYPTLFKWKLDRVLLYRAREEISRLAAWSLDICRAQAKRCADENRPDLFTSMMAAEEKRTGNPDIEGNIKDIWAESMFLLAAGSESTATTMAITYHYLVHQPDLLAKVTAEVRSAFSNVEDIRTGETLDSLRMFQACILETLRISPAAPNTLPRIVPAGGATVDGHFLPGGTTVGTSLYTMHHNEKYFDDPDSFVADRWLRRLEDSAGKDIAYHPSPGYAPFSMGTRNCLGWRLAWAEMTVALARVLFSFDMRLTSEAPCCATRQPGKACEPNAPGYITMCAAGGPYVEFRPRQG
ncbi:uncharacterized protein LTR77_001682 [Saxophila tyrrhenica]|uniref:Cytochrome P450 monooxygenase n=1 Tax=Saxophila tyrrhenica TaxID=1690608 RepID=A0AAV9PLE4_9PEZI|nr:hypothetical protein LTR77_001682 [Saxophila tyrrhenica]